ncbi:hypothetical protein [Granulicella sibirica]|uniref:Uncharacterized protein n=1 Tax=Granulicella sibirica TaxID=2479048 RepID=A0A4Q0T9R8_9BACT|nr:hypothetical protein [Granulicella sibirica]RXH58371.1 hypothetical protein GRAN_1681 [Granulicella sibirica]
MTPTQTSKQTRPASPTPRLSGQGYFFGVPVGDLGWFTSLLMATATGFAAFFAATFVGIISLLVYNTAGSHAIDYSFAYKRFGLPIGVVVLFIAYAYLGTLWARRQLRRA